MDNSEDLHSLRREDGKQTAGKMIELVTVGRPIVKESNLVKEAQPIGDREITAVRELIESVSPIDIHNYQLHQHLQLTGKFARKIGQTLKNAHPHKYDNLNLDELEILGLLHDFGRFTTHRFLRNDAIGKIELREMGIRQDLLQKLPSLNIYLNKDPNNQEQITAVFDGLSVEQKIIELADICGKRKPDGGIRLFEEVMNYHKQSRSHYQALTGVEEIWISEKSKDENFIAFSEKVYRKIQKWLSEEGTDTKNIRTYILEEEQNAPVQAIIFDVGNVLVPNPEGEVINDIAQRFGIRQRETETKWAETLPPFQTREISEEEFWSRLSQNIGKPLPENHQSMATDKLRTKRDPQFDELLKELKEKGYILAVHSDTIPPHLQAFRQAGTYDGFDIEILSPEIKVTKRSKEAFIIAALKLWLPPQACVFVDDKPEYVRYSKQAGQDGYAYSSFSQLEQEFKKNRIL